STTEIADLKKKIQKKQAEVAATAKAPAGEEKNLKEEAVAKEILLKKYLDACEKSLQQGDIVQAFKNFGKAKQIRNNPEVAAMEIRLKAIQARIEEQKRLTQKKYLDDCKKSLQQGNFDLAGKNLIEAKQIGNSPEVVELENQLKILLNKASPEPKTEVVSKPPDQAKILPGKISDLTSDLTENYLSLVQRISISDVIGNFSASGFVAATMKIAENGRAWVKSVNDNGLSAEPESYREKIRKAITLSLSKLSFPEPKNKVGKRITVENWRVNFKVGQFSGKIRITRQ
ncbi:MAG: hypothetical protein WCL37_07445, partial [Chrysiogenales bacterium]